MAPSVNCLAMIPTGNSIAASGKFIPEACSSFAPSVYFARNQRAISIKRPLQARAALQRGEKLVPSAGSPVSWLEKAGQNCARTAAAAGLALLLNLSPAAPPSLAEEVLVRLPSANEPVERSFELEPLQRTLIETWGIVKETFVDPTFNDHDWFQELEDGLIHVSESESEEEAYGNVKEMLARLGDPFTRIVTPPEYARFQVTSEGAVQGVGLLLASDPDSGKLVVLSPVEGGPAERAGIQAGDELLAIDNASLAGLSGQDAANLLRGKAGTSVKLTVKRGASEAPDDVVTAELQREVIELSPVYATLLPHSDDSGHTANTGYIRLSTFSQNAGQQMAMALLQLEEAGVDNYILDLRDNPGGLLKVGFQVASLWLDGDSVLVNTVDRFGGVQSLSLPESNPFHITDRPLVVLVNSSSASASEILAVALKDNQRATVMGDERTYGKGRIQSVFELSDGSALFVTVAKYLSPTFQEIDRIGVSPDLSCSVPTAAVATSASLPPPGAFMGEPLPRTEGGAFVRVVGEESVQLDSCVLAAERQLDSL